MSGWFEKVNALPTRTLYMADLAIHCIVLGLGWGQIPEKPTVGKGSLQIFIQEHPTLYSLALSLVLLFASPTPMFHSGFYLLLTFSGMGTFPITPIWPLLPHLFSIWCVPMQKEYGGVFLGKFQTHLPLVLLPAVQLLFPICSLGSPQGHWSTPKSNTCQLFHN